MEQRKEMEGRIETAITPDDCEGCGTIPARDEMNVLALTNENALLHETVMRLEKQARDLERRLTRAKRTNAGLMNTIDRLEETILGNAAVIAEKGREIEELQLEVDYYRGEGRDDEIDDSGD